MDKWSIIAICIVVPAVLFLVTVAVVSAIRLSRKQVHFFLLTGLFALPVAVACRWISEWMGNQLWMRDRWWFEFSRFSVDIIGGTAAFLVAYALIVLVTLAIRRGLGGRASRATGG